MRTVLFVCAANICRSPMAEAVFNALAEDSGSPWQAHSAGIAAPEGAPAAPYATEALAEIGVHVDPDRVALQVDEAMVENADVVLAMTPRQTDELRRLFGHRAGKKIHSLAEYVGGGPDAGVADPQGHPRVAYRATARQLLGYMELLVPRVEGEDRTYPERGMIAG